MNLYYTGIILNRVPTGFGIYTGISLTNSGNFPVEYSLSVSNTTLLGVANTDAIDNELPNKTIFISENFNNDLSDQQSISKIVNPKSSGIFYVLHKPFSNYKSSVSPASGYEIAQITVKTISSLGDQDDNIIIDVSGQRILTQPTPKKVGKFYGVSDYLPNTSTNLQYNWGVIDVDSYVTGFRIETATDNTFSTIIDTLDYQIPMNSNENYPLYGQYNGFDNYNFQATLQNLNISQDYYTRISGLNSHASGSYTYVTGYKEYFPILDDTAYSGLTLSPGSNLKLNPTGLYLEKISDFETDFDLYDFIYKANNNSSNFTKYTGIIVKFFPKENLLATYKSSSTSLGAINFIEPNDEQKRMIFSVDGSNNFRIQLEFENTCLYGKGGDGLKWNADGSYSQPQNGGPIFNIDNIAYDFGGVTRQINFYIYKDIDSIFAAGPAGGKGWIITENTNETTNTIKLAGTTVTDLIDYNLIYIHP